MIKHLFFISCIFLNVVTAQTITTVAGNGNTSFTGDGGQATSASLLNPNVVAVDANGNFYIGDGFNYRIRKVDGSGVINTIAGTGSFGSTGDGGPAMLAKFGSLGGMVTFTTGEIYFSDKSNHKIRMINAGGTITTVAGTGTAGFSGDGAAATLAQLNNPGGIAKDALGNIYVADQNNHRIRMITPSGSITTIAGNGTQGFAGDGSLAVNAQLNLPSDISIGQGGKIYIADRGNYRIRMIDAGGTITTVAGTGTAGYSGDGGSATAAQMQPYGIETDAVGNIYSVERFNFRVRIINSSGIITNFCGTGAFGFSGDGGPATSAQLYNATDIVLKNATEFLIPDVDNNRIRKITLPTTGMNSSQWENDEIIAFPNPTADFITLSGVEGSTLFVYNLIGEKIISAQPQGDKFIIDLSKEAKGIYLIKISKQNKIYYSRVVKE